MPGNSHKWIVTNGQRAAICGLVIAGVPIAMACKIVRAPYVSALSLLPPRWHKRRPSGPTRWKGNELEQVKKAYQDASKPVREIAAWHGVSRRAIHLLASKHGWRRRQLGRPKIGVEMSPEQRRLYKKIRPVLGREAALQEALR
jgi:hypothetical protein